MSGSDLALNDAARHARNMMQQPAVVQWAVLGELRQTRQENQQAMAQLEAKRRSLPVSTQNTQRRGQIEEQFQLLATRDQALLSAIQAQLIDMGPAGSSLLYPGNYPEWIEGFGSARAMGGLNFKGMSSAGVGAKLDILKGANHDAKAVAEAEKAAAAGAVEAEVVALRKIGQNPNGPDLSSKDANYILYKQAEKISTAGSKQATAPRDLWEQILWNRVLEDPAAGRPLPLSGDDRFPRSEGFMKMEATHSLPDGKSITIHYQYNSITGKPYDMKIVTPQRSVLQLGRTIRDRIP